MAHFGAANRRRLSRPKVSYQRQSLRWTVAGVRITVLGIAIALVALLGMEPIRDYASASFMEDLASEQDGEAFVGELFNALNRSNIYAAVAERRVSLDTIISPGFDRNWVVPPHPDQTKRHRFDWFRLSVRIVTVPRLTFECSFMAKASARPTSAFWTNV